MPYLKELSPILKRDFPAIWQRFREVVRSDDVAEFDAMGNGPVLPIEVIIGPKVESKSENEAAP